MMRTLRRNKQAMKYSIKGERQPIYVLDENGNKIVEFVDDEGNVYYRETGSYTNGWHEPVEFMGNIAMSGGEVEAQEYGLSVADYDSTIIYSKNEYPIKEGSLIWVDSNVEYKDIEQNEIIESSADYKVVKVSNSLNVTKLVLKGIVK